jgi:CheY-like chemotaxis protein
MPESPTRKTFNPRKLRALVAEDNKLNQQLIKLQLQDLNLEVEVVKTGMEAVSVFGNEQFDIVFLDCQMPELDGYATARIIKKLQEQRETQIPIIAVTTNALEDCKAEYLAAGMVDYITKPVEPLELEKILRNWSKEVEKISTLTQRITTGQFKAPGLETFIDISLLASRFSEKNYQQLLSMFATAATSEVTTLQAHLSKQDYKALRSAAHGFKGACLTICAPKLVSTLQELEEAAATSDLTQCHSLLARLDNEIIEAVDESQGHLQAHLQARRGDSEG